MSEVVAAQEQQRKLWGWKASWLTANLTSKQVERLEMQKDAVDKAGNVGYIDPSQVVNYFCAKCGNIYEGSPKLSVFIEEPVESTLSELLPGHYGFMCGTCDGLVAGGPIVKDEIQKDKPDLKYIVSDLSGEYIPITPERIDGLLKECETAADAAEWKHAEFGRAERWATKINYPLDPARLKAIEDLYEKRDLERYERGFKDKVDDIFEIINDEVRYGSLEHIDSVNDSTEWALVEDIEELLEKAPKINIPADEELMRKIIFITTRYKEGVIDRELKETREEIKEIEGKIGDLNKRTEELKAEKKKVEVIEDKIKELGFSVDEFLKEISVG